MPCLSAEVPGAEDPKRLDTKTVNVTVVLNGYSSSTSPAAEFTYPASN